jgi:oxygen-dependent protoporphyrinogen oxidase
MQATKASGRPVPTPIFGLPGGLQAMTDTLAGRLGNTLRTGKRVSSIRRAEGEWRLRFTGGDQLTADELILAVPQPALAQMELPEALTPALSQLATLPHPDVTVLALGFRRSEVDHPLDGFGALRPAKEPGRALGVLFPGSIFSGRAPEDHVLLSVFVGGTRHPEDARLSADEQLSLVAPELQTWLGIRGEPVMAKAIDWPAAIPQYRVGYGEVLKAIEAAEAEFPNLQLRGNYRGGIGVPDRVQAGEDAAAALRGRILQ